VSSTPQPPNPQAHLTGANRSATNPGAFWSITNGATVVTVTDTIAAFTKHLKEKKKVNEVDDPKHRKHLGFNASSKISITGIGRFFCPETVRSWLPPPHVTEQGFQSEISKE